VLLAAGTVAIKVVLIPRLLFRAIRDVSIRRDVNPLIGYGSSLFRGRPPDRPRVRGLRGTAAALGRRVALLVPASLSDAALGLLLLISRTKAVTQVVGYLIVENGIFLFGTSLLVEMPTLVRWGSSSTSSSASS